MRVMGKLTSPDDETGFTNIRALTKPYPGAWTIYKDIKLAY